MIGAAVPKLVQYLPGIFVLALIAGGILFGRLKHRGRSDGASQTCLDGWLGDDSPHHHGDGVNHGGDAGIGHNGE